MSPKVCFLSRPRVSTLHNVSESSFIGCVRGADEEGFQVLELLVNLVT